MATRLRSTPRVERLFRRLPHLTAFSAVELVLLVLIAVQAARLVWTLLTPVGPVGDWRESGALTVPANDSALTDFDPFFRLSSGGAPATVTSLDLKLFGVREDRATGRGSAIIAVPDGTQRSFVVGEEIIPGVTLAQVGFDSVTINRNGTPEQIFLDQSRPAQSGAASAPATQPGQTAPAAPPQMAPAPAPDSQIRVQTRMRGGRVSGLVLSPGNDGGYALRAAGLRPGDMLVSVNGRQVSSMDEVRAIVRQAGGDEVSVIVVRGGRAVPLRVRLDL